jgi:hypothetical protein
MDLFAPDAVDFDRNDAGSAVGFGGRGFTENFFDEPTNHGCRKRYSFMVAIS